MPDVHGFGSQFYTFQRKVTLDASSVPAGNVQRETFTVNGLKSGLGPVVVNKPTFEAGIEVVAARVSAANTLELTFWNYSGGAVNPASQDYDVVQL
jgi:hypothetical protein